MSYYVAGDTIQEPFVSESLATGLTFTRIASYQAGSAVTWNPTIAEVGSGAYTFTYVTTTASTTGSWVWIATASNGETVTWEFDVNATAATITITATATAALTQTLAQLRRRCARELGDYDTLTATSNGTTTTIIDIDHINTATNDMSGQWIVPTNGTNNGLKRVVTAFNDSTNTITVRAMTAASNSGDTFDVFNKYGRGFKPEQYDSAINDAINDAFPLHMIEQVATISPAFDADSGAEVTVPASFVYVHMVEWQDDDGYWNEVPWSAVHARYGWIADSAAGEIRILGTPGADIDGKTIRLTGYGRQGTLSSDSDTCTIPAEWIVAKACASLCLAGITKDSSYGPKVGIYEKRWMGLRTRIRTMPKTGSQKVRAA